VQTQALAVRLTRRQIRALRFGHKVPADKTVAAVRKQVEAIKLKRKPRDGITWDPVIGMRLWNVGLFGPDHTFQYRQIIIALRRPVLDYRS
jgi:hypothetical protein